MNEASVTLNAIEEARARLKGLVHETPLDMSHTITTLADRETYLKLENLQRTGSFKIRGASNCIMTLSPEQKERGIIAASAGNHAQGVALGGTMNAIRSTVVMPEAAPCQGAGNQGLWCQCCPPRQDFRRILGQGHGNPKGNRRLFRSSL